LALKSYICGGGNLFASARSFVVKSKNLLPIIFHADDDPVVLLRLVVQRLRERADLRIGEPFT